MNHSTDSTHIRAGSSASVEHVPEFFPGNWMQIAQESDVTLVNNVSAPVNKLADKSFAEILLRGQAK